MWCGCKFNDLAVVEREGLVGIRELRGHDAGAGSGGPTSGGSASIWILGVNHIVTCAVRSSSRDADVLEELR